MQESQYRLVKHFAKPGEYYGFIEMTRETVACRTEAENLCHFRISHDTIERNQANERNLEMFPGIYNNEEWKWQTSQ